MKDIEIQPNWPQQENRHLVLFSGKHHFSRGINDHGIVSEFDFTCTYCYKFLKISLDFPSEKFPYFNISQLYD